MKNNFNDYKSMNNLDKVTNDIATTNKITNNIYTCGVCNKSFETIEGRNAHEAKCLADRKKTQAALEKKKLEEKKSTRKAEIEKKYKELATLVNDYCKDYGSLQLGESRYFDDNNFPALSKLLGWWF